MPEPLNLPRHYFMPPHGWTCFHCGETFTTPGSARDHFGADPLAEPGCKIKVGAERGLLMALRKAEDELARYRQDDSLIARELHRLQSELSDKLQSAEELGYERGLAVGKRLCRSPSISKEGE